MELEEIDILSKFNENSYFIIFRINEGGLKYFASTGGLEV